MPRKAEKTVLITSEFPPLPGGIGDHALNLAKALAQSGREVTVLADHRDSDTQKELQFDRSLPFRVVRVRRYLPACWTYWYRLVEGVRLLRGREPLTVIASGKASLWLSALLSLLFLKHAYAAVIHGTELRAGGRFGRRLTRWSLFRFEKLIAVSYFTKQLVARVAPSLKVEVINNGVTLGKAGRQVTPVKLKGSPVLITVGNVTSRKGQHNVIRALPLLRRYYPDIHYYLVGMPTAKSVFSKLAVSLGVEGHMTFYGTVSEDLKQKLLKGADIFLMLSEEQPDGDVEGFGIAVVEAASCGVPSIGARDSGIEDAIEDGVSGHLVDPRDPKEVLIAVQDIMMSEEMFRSRAEEWSEQFTWEVVGKRYVECLTR